MEKFIGEYSALLSMVLRNKKIKCSELKNMYCEGVKSQYAERRNELFEKALRQFEEYNIVFIIDEYVILRGEDKICQCDECGTFFAVIDVPTSINKEHGKIIVSEILDASQDEIAYDSMYWQSFCPKCSKEREDIDK